MTSISSPSGPLPPPPPDQRRSDDERRRRMRLFLTDTTLALLLLLALGIVFMLDRRSAGNEALYARNATTERFLFDPLNKPIAEVRQNPQRQRWIGAYGGTDESELAVQRGLDWLARHQSIDGHWGPDSLRAAPDGRCKPGDVCPNGGSEHRVALTGLAVLAFLAGGHYDFNASEYSGCVRHALDWLVAHQRPDGAFIDPEHATAVNMYEHGIAAFALADACEMAASLELTPNDRYRQSAQRAVQFIQYAQHHDGGWRYTDDRAAASDVSVSGWQMLALNAARRAEIVAVSDDCVTRMLAFFKRCEDKSSGRTFYQPGNNLPSDAPTAIGMLVHQFVLETPESPLVASGAKYLAGEAESSFVQARKVKKKKWSFAAQPGDYYTYYNGTLAMFQAGGPEWKRWNDVIRDMLIDRQCEASEGCRRGSWDPTGRWGPEGGRVYSTALAVLSLEVYYRYTSERAKVYAEIGKQSDR